MSEYQALVTKSQIPVCDKFWTSKHHLCILLRFHRFHVLVAAERPHTLTLVSLSPFSFSYTRGRYALNGRTRALRLCVT